MKEFLLLIRTEEDHLAKVSPAEQQKHVEKVGQYIGQLVKEGKLKSAQPLEMEGTIISTKQGKLKDGPFNETKEVIAGYFLVQAQDLDDAIAIAKANPVFEFDQSRIEVRPIKRIEGIN